MTLGFEPRSSSATEAIAPLAQHNAASSTAAAKRGRISSRPAIAAAQKGRRRGREGGREGERERGKTNKKRRGVRAEIAPSTGDWCKETPESSKCGCNGTYWEGNADDEPALEWLKGGG